MRQVAFICKRIQARLLKCSHPPLCAFRITFCGFVAFTLLSRVAVSLFAWVCELQLAYQYNFASLMELTPDFSRLLQHIPALQSHTYLVDPPADTGERLSCIMDLTSSVRLGRRARRWTIVRPGHVIRLPADTVNDL